MIDRATTLDAPAGQLGQTGIDRANLEETFRTEMSPQFLARVAGLPIEVVEQLRLQRSRHWVDGVLALEDALEALKQPLVDGLFSAVSGLEEPGLRRRLVNLKREVFNLRSRVDLDAAFRDLDRLEPAVRDLLAEWIRIHRELRGQLAAGEAIFEDELAEKRALLKGVFEDPDFRKGLLLSSTQLDASIGNYLRSDNRKLNRRQRLTERSLYQYLLRTACKTSPFSTFTPVAMGSFSEQASGAIEGIEYQARDMRKASFVRLNLGLLSKLSGLLLTNEEVKSELPVQVVTGWTFRGGRLRYIRRTFKPTNPGSQAIVDPMHESVLKLPSGDLMRELLEVMKDGRREKLGALIAQLSAADGANRPEEKIEDYLQHLLRLGFLTLPGLRLDINSPDPLRDFVAGLRQVEHPLTGQLADRLQQVAETLSLYEQGSLDERREHLRRIGEEIAECFRLAGAPAGEIDATLIYEDTTLAPAKLLIGRREWKRVTDDLAELHQLLPIFDFNLPRRLVTKGFFKARFEPGARCDDFLKFADEFNLDYFEQYLKRGMRRKTLDEQRRFVGAENTLKQPEIDALNRARQDFADYLQEVYSALPREAEDLQLDSGRLRQICRDLPHPVGVESQSYFCQFGLENGEPKLAINRAYAGFGLLFSRFAQFLSEGEDNDLLAELRQAIAAIEPAGAVLAELKGGYDTTNLNLHPAVTRYELVCPGDLSTRPLDEQISLEDLSVRHSLEDDSVALYSKRLGVQVIPVYLGFLLPMALPEIQQVLLNFAYLPLCPVAVWTGIDTESAEQEGISRYPRISLGSLVLERAMWKMLPEILPKRETEESDATFYLRMSRWARSQGLPRQVFVTPDSQFARGGLGGGGNRDAYKPLYVDFDDIFSLNLLEATARGAGSRLVLKEMLPSRDQLWLRNGGGSYVTELVLETNRRKTGIEQ